MYTFKSAGHIQKYSMVNYQNTLRSASDPEQESMSPHYFDFVGPHFMVVNQTSIAKIILGRFPPLKGMVLSFWPPELLKSSEYLPPWWLKAVRTLENMVIRFSNVPIEAKIFEALLVNSPLLTHLTIEVDLFGINLFPSSGSGSRKDRRKIAKTAKISQVFKNLKSLTIINLNTFFYSRNFTPSLLSRNWNFNLMRIQQWTSGSLEALSIRNSDNGNYLFEGSFNDDCVLPFILNNLTTLKYLDLYNVVIQPKHLKRIIRHVNFKRLKLNSLIIEIRSDITSRPEGLDVLVSKPFEPNFQDVLRILKTQETILELFVRMDSWDKTTIRKILKCVPNLEVMCFCQLGTVLEGMANNPARIDMSNIFSLYSPTLRVLKFSCEFPKELIDATRLKNIQIFRASKVEPDFFQSLPEGLTSLTLRDIFVTNSTCFQRIFERCPNLTSFSLKCNEEMLGNEGFKKIVRGLKMLKYLEITESLVSNIALFDHHMDNSEAEQPQSYSSNCSESSFSPSNILSCLKFLEELKLVYFPYVTSSAFSSIKNPKLRKINLSQNVGVDEFALMEIIQNNRALEHITINRCPRIQIQPIIKIIKAGRNLGREIGIEFDNSFVSMSACLKNITQCGREIDICNGKSTALDELSRLLEFSNHSIPTQLENTESDTDESSEEHINCFYNMMKRMRIREKVLGESFMASFVHPEVNRQAVDLQTGGQVSRIIQTFCHNGSTTSSIGFVTQTLVSKDAVCIDPKSRADFVQTTKALQVQETSDSVLFTIGNENQSTRSKVKKETSASTTVSYLTVNQDKFSVDKVEMQPRDHYDWAT